MIGPIEIGPGAYLGQGTAVRAAGGGVAIGAGTALLETGVIVGRPDMPASVGRRTVFGHLARVIGARIGDLCEIGNATVIMPGAVLGDRVFTGEGTLIPEGMTVPDNAVGVGRHVIAAFPGEGAHIELVGEIDRYFRLVANRPGHGRASSA